MPVNIASYKVFIASPGGLQPERRAFRETIEEFNQRESLSRGALFVPVNWAEIPPGMGRSQEIINEEILSADYFVLVLWDRWGTFPGISERHHFPQQPTSGTHEEFLLATKCYEDANAPLREIAVFFKHVPAKQMADAGTELTKVLKFRSELEKGQRVFCQTFDDIQAFAQYLRALLAKWLMDHQAQGATSASTRVPLAAAAHTDPEAFYSGPVSAGGQLDAWADVLREAWDHANRGENADAEALFAKAVATGSADSLESYARFLRYLGRTTEAENAYNRLFALGIGDQERWKAEALIGLATIARKRGKLLQALKMLDQALQIYSRFPPGAGLATVFMTKGMVQKDDGKLGNAEELQRKALDVFTSISDTEGIARCRANLGIIFKHRKQYDLAIQEYQRVVNIAQQLHREDLAALAYGNLGVSYGHTGQLDEAEDELLKALRIAERLKRVDMEAASLTNLGMVYLNREEYKSAAEVLRKAIDLHCWLENRHAMVVALTNLAIVQQNTGELDGAEQSYMEALRVHEQMDHRPSSLAPIYGGLAEVYEARGELVAAEQALAKAVEFTNESKDPEEFAAVLNNMGFIAEKRGDIDKAGRHYHEAAAVRGAEKTAAWCRTYMNLARLEDRAGNVDLATKHLGNALQTAQQLGRQDLVHEIESLQNSAKPERDVLA